MFKSDKNSREPNSGSRSPTAATTSQSSDNVNTLREVLTKQAVKATAAAIVSGSVNKDDKNEDKHGDERVDNELLTTVSSPTSSLTDSRSSADIPSELLDISDSRVSDADATVDRHRSKLSSGLVHGHILPTGWACKYNAYTDEYKFEYQTMTKACKQSDQAVSARTPTKDDIVQTSRRPTLHLFECKYGYHFPSSPTSSMISELAKQVQKGSAPGAPTQPSSQKTRQIGYGKHKLTVPSDEDEQIRRLRDMFPTAPAPIIEQMIRIYHGREGLIKAAMISLGYKRSTEYSVQQATAQSPIMLMMSKPSSKKLFDKLVSYFPDKDETLIKSMMYKHKEIEHEIISALVESGQETCSARKYTQSQLDSALRADRNGAIMKLRYLKSLYPTCEEIELYHLLNCNDLNAQKVMELIEQKGHKSINIEEVMQYRKSQTQQMRAQQAAHAAKDKETSSASDLVQAHLQRPKPTVTEARVNNLIANLKKVFEQYNDGLIIGALEAADYNEGLAKKFLQEMMPADDSLFKQRYALQFEIKPDVVAFPCKSIQAGNTNFMSIISDENVYIPREVIECDHALALLKVDASTFTQDDFPKEKFSHRLGRQIGLSKGSSFARKETSSKESLKQGPKSGLRSGTKYVEVCLDDTRPKPNGKAIGHKKSLVHGRNLALNCGHNSSLLKRVHPFFKVKA